MRVLNANEHSQIAGGQNESEMSSSCINGTLVMLSACEYQELQAINALFKAVILSDEMQDADNQARLEALKSAIASLNA